MLCSFYYLLWTYLCTCLSLLTRNRLNAVYAFSLLWAFSYSAIVSWRPPTCSQSSVLSAVFSFRQQSDHTAPAPDFFQWNRSVQQCASLCLMLLYWLDPVTAKSPFRFFVFVVTPKTLEIEWAVSWWGVGGGGVSKGWATYQVKITFDESFVLIS